MKTKQTDKPNQPQSIIFYTRDKHHKPFGILLAKKNGNSVSIGYSFCCKKDVFDKKMGKKIAEGRADVYQDSGLVEIKYANGQIGLVGDRDKSNETHRTVKIPAGMCDTVGEFVERCKTRYTECCFPTWTTFV